MAIVYYGLIVVYPVLSFIILKVLGNQGSWIEQLKNEFYLWIGFTLAYVGVLFLFLIPAFALSALVSFIIYTIGYFAVSILRKTKYTESGDIFKGKSIFTKEGQ